MGASAPDTSEMATETKTTKLLGRQPGSIKRLFKEMVMGGAYPVGIVASKLDPQMAHQLFFLGRGSHGGD